MASYHEAMGTMLGYWWHHARVLMASHQGTRGFKCGVMELCLKELVASAPFVLALEYRMRQVRL